MFMRAVLTFEQIYQALEHNEIALATRLGVRTAG